MRETPSHRPLKEEIKEKGERDTLSRTFQRRNEEKGERDTTHRPSKENEEKGLRGLLSPDLLKKYI